MTTHAPARSLDRGNRRRLVVATFAISFGCIATFAGCDINSFRLGGNTGSGQDGGTNDDGGGGNLDDGGNPIIDAPVVFDANLPDACVAEAEICGDDADNDCDGNVDEGFDLDNDPANCGACGNQCSRIKAAGSCNLGTCEYECLPGFYDLDGDLADDLGNGCDYGPCIITAAVDDVCDLADEDCDGSVDEDVDMMNDPDNCSTCGNVCQAINATAACQAGACEYTCVDGYVDTIPALDGCEYECPVNPPEMEESCNNVDDDCDAIIDENAVGLGGTCTEPGFEMIGDTGECTFGTEVCSFGVPTCMGYQGPQAEICDDLDNNCDGTADEIFDKQNDVNYCGGCTPCDLPNAIPSCNMGTCEILACQAGYVNSDGMDATGCNYECTPSGPEVCDGVDNDCDEIVDEEVTAPLGLCKTEGPCAGTTPTCGQSPCDAMSAVQWRCIYSGPEADMCGDVPLQEALCDDMDGDCDGNSDESFSLKGTACDDGNIGACQGTGAYICDPMDAMNLICEITSPGQTAAAEVCNGIDDDCNGFLDDGAPDDMVPVDDGAGGTFFIYTYEASRPDAELTSPGAASHRSCSKPDAIPWQNVSWTEANQACIDAGYRLCTEAEWELSCAGLANNTYPYGNVYDPDACNGKDHDPDCMLPNDDTVLPTGSAYGCPAPPMDSVCVSEPGAYDLSGNLKEWTATQVQAGPPAAYRVRGGSFDNIEQGLTCQLDFISLEEDFYFTNLGFRCCSDTAP